MSPIRSPRSIALLSPLLLSGAALAQGAGPFQYVREDGGWTRIEASGRFRVHPEVISLRFAEADETLAGLRAKLADLPAEAVGLVARLEPLRRNQLGVHDLRVGAGDDVLEVVAVLRASGLVEFAEENTLGEYVATPNDPGLGLQWSLINTGQTGGTSDADVDADLAWDVTTGAPAIVVAVIDSGTEVSHSDLAANVWTNPGEVPNNGQDDDGNGLVDDYYGWDFVNNNNQVPGPFYHGTAVTGVIGAVTNNGIGIAGLAGGWSGLQGCLTMAVGVGDFGPDGGILDDAIIYAVNEGAQVLTMSLTVGSSTAINNALDYAWNQRGRFVDCAAGNTGSGVSYPANNPDVVAVPATDHNDERPSWSAFGPENWVAAPGVDIYMTSLGNGYTTASGTSFSAPHVAAGAGLVYTILPNTSNESVKEILKLTADDIPPAGFDNNTGWGRLNAAAAVQHALANDCNLNGVYDPEDIASGNSSDGNGNGIPDECECPPPSTYCLTAPNSNGPGAQIGYSGSNSVAANDMLLEVTGASTNRPGIFYYGTTQQQLPFGNGFRCVGGQTFRLPLLSTDAFGDATFALDIDNPPQPGGQIQVGDTWYFQFWFRDPTGGGSNFNLSDGLEAPFCP